VIIRTGIDLARIDRFARLSENPRFLRRVFTTSELIDCRPAHLAGTFAAKEAIIKAVGIPLAWHALEIVRGPSGRPRVGLTPSDCLSTLQAIDVSISHDGDYAVAVAVAIFSATGDDA